MKLDTAIAKAQTPSEPSGVHASIYNNCAGDDRKDTRRTVTVNVRVVSDGPLLSFVLCAFSKHVAVKTCKKT